MYLLRPAGRLDEAVRENRRAIDRDPLNPLYWMHQGYLEFLARRYDESVRAGAQALEIVPGYWLGLWQLSAAESMRGNAGRAVELARRGLELSPASTWPMGALAIAHAKGGEPDRARELIASMLVMSNERFVAPSSLAQAFAAVSDRAEALAWIERGIDVHDPMVIDVAINPAYDLLRGEPAFDRLTARIAAPAA
jgi:tetratricopeptide (TPR) repeat protein